MLVSLCERSRWDSPIAVNDPPPAEVHALGEDWQRCRRDPAIVIARNNPYQFNTCFVQPGQQLLDHLLALVSAILEQVASDQQSARFSMEKKAL